MCLILNRVLGDATEAFESFSIGDHDTPTQDSEPCNPCHVSRAVEKSFCKDLLPAAGLGHTNHGCRRGVAAAKNRLVSHSGSGLVPLQDAHLAPAMPPPLLEDMSEPCLQFGRAGDILCFCHCFPGPNRGRCFARVGTVPMAEYCRKAPSQPFAFLVFVGVFAFGAAACCARVGSCWPLSRLRMGSRRASKSAQLHGETLANEAPASFALAERQTGRTMQPLQPLHVCFGQPDELLDVRVTWRLQGESTLWDVTWIARTGQCFL